MKDETKQETTAEETEKPEQQADETKQAEKPAEQSKQETFAEPPKDTAPTLEQLQAENTKLRAEVIRGRLDAEVMAQAPTLGADPKATPYLMKLADLTNAVNGKGEVDKEAVTEALKRVLDDLPALKKAPEQSGGFQTVGGDGQRQSNTHKKAVPTKRWNRYH